MKEIPLLFGKPSDKALFDPKHFLAHIKMNKKVDIAIIYFSSKTSKLIKKRFKAKGEIDFEKTNFKPIKIGKKNVLFIKSTIGSAAAVTVAEEVIALGAKKIIFVGSCGTLKDLPISSIIIPDKAIRDEGTSYHYAKADKYSNPSKKLTKLIEDSAKELELEYEKGTTWTTDAPYRETFRKIKKYAKEDTLCVEMEASALFTLAKFRKIDIAGVFWVSDQLLKKWVPGFETKHYKDGAKTSFEIVENMLKKLCK